MALKQDFVLATVNVKLKPWSSPMFAVRFDQVEDSGQGIPVRELDDDALEDLALAWVRKLYENAGRTHCPFYKPVKAIKVPAHD